MESFVTGPVLKMGKRESNSSGENVAWKSRWMEHEEL